MKKKFLSRIAACAAAAVLVLGLGLAAGCSQQAADEPEPSDPTELIRTEIATGFDEVKDEIANMSSSELSDMFDAEDLAMFEAMGLDGGEFVKSLLSGFDYEIGDITVNGTEAEAAVTMKMKDLKEWIGLIEDGAIAIAMENPNISEDELMAKIGPLMMDSLEKVEGMVDIPITVKAGEQNGEWVVDSDALGTEISGAMMNALADEMTAE